MKSTKKDNLKNDEINNNIKQIYVNKQGKLLVDYSTPINEIKLVNKLNYKKTSIDYQQQSFFEPFDESFNQNENVELQKINSSNRQSIINNQINTNQIINEKKKDDDTISRKSIKSQENFDKRNSKRRTSTVLELKNYDQWIEDIEEDNQTKSQIKKLDKNKLEILIDKRKDQESNRPINNTKIKLIQNNERNRTWTCILMLGFLILSIVIYSKFLEKDTKNKDSKEYRIKFRENELRTFDLLDDNGNRVLTIHYGLKVPRDLKPIKCSKLSKGAKVSYICRDWLYRASLTIGIDSKPNRINCYNIEWASYTSKEELKDCFDLNDGYWYGIGLVRNEPWPLNDWKQKMAPFVTSDQRTEESPFGSIIRRYWLSSDGVSISVPLDIPLSISFNDSTNNKEKNQMCFQANLAHYPYDAETATKLEYSICTGDNLKQLHTESSKVWSQASTIAFDLDKSPEMEFIRKPIWATHHLSELNQTILHKFTKQINDITNVTGFLLIDDRWQNQIGELRVNQTNFPTAMDTFKALTNRGWKTLLTVSPLINIVSDLLHETAYQKRIIHDLTLQVPLLTKCSPEENLKFCAVIDILQLPNGEWLKKRLIDNIIKRYSIDGLMFVGVETSRMPQYHHNQLHNIVNPDYYQISYIDIAASTTKYIGMTTSAGVKDLQGFVRIPALENSWSALNSIIPTVLNLGLVGFSLVNTGSVGGDIMLNSKDDELYIRWLELSLFLPIIQFSKVENINNIKIFKKYQHIRKTDLLPVMQRCLLDYNQNGWPIIRPLWWLAPDDQDLYKIKDQFAIGQEIVVAPILNKGQIERNISLPEGLWQDMITSKIEKGGKTLLNYKINLNQIAYFKRVKE